MVRLCAILCLLAFPAYGQTTQCGPREVWVKMMAAEFGASRVSIGISGKAVVETYANPETGKFTILAVLPTGKACVLATGHNWHADKPETPGTDS